MHSVILTEKFVELNTHSHGQVNMGAYVGYANGSRMLSV